MEIYKNISEQSNVFRYEIGKDYIIVEFETIGKDGCNTYKYTYESTGSEDVENMKQLAIEGIGLNSFINKQIKKRYDHKW